MNQEDAPFRLILVDRDGTHLEAWNLDRWGMPQTAALWVPGTGIADTRWAWIRHEVLKTVEAERQAGNV